MCVHKIYRALRRDKKESGIGAVLGVLVTYIFVCCCWVPFRTTDTAATFEILSRMFIWQKGIVHIYSWTVVAIITVLISTAVAVIRSKQKGEVVTGFYPVFDLGKTGSLILLFAFIGIIIIFAYTESNPFIYFQF